ncbi:hypothetical protein IAD21_04433 [Abditibacteriota bacterium]|nr:hypothetical protein IAD21_04433 [Abditibacteriota bacterium]
MNNRRVVVNNSFNGKRFEKFSTVEEKTGDTHFSFAIDGVEVSKEQWTQMREDAIAHDMARPRTQIKFQSPSN